jgi:hypothetical protein
MPEIIRNASVWVGGVKVSEAQTAELDLNSNSTVAIGDGGAIGATQAPFTGQIAMKKWQVIGGTAAGTKLQTAFMRRKYISVNYGTADGTLWKCPCIVGQLKSTSDMAKGTCEGDYTLLLAGEAQPM